MEERPDSLEPRSRRSQEERRNATRLALLEATISCLVEFGYAGVTTTRVVERAGVSRGAQVHHFPTKAILVSEAVTHLARQRSQQAVAELLSLPRDGNLIGATLDVLWERHQDDTFTAALEIWVAARTDEELRGQIINVEREVSSAITGIASKVIDDPDITRQMREDLNVALATMRGMALINLATGVDAATMQRRWQRARTRMLETVSPQVVAAIEALGDFK